jgi:hypothetical protein
MIKIECKYSAGDEEHYAYIRRNPKSLLYGTPRFMSLIGRHLGAQPGWLSAKRDEEIVGLLPFMKKDGSLGPVFNSLAYYGSNGGVIQHRRDDDAKTELISTFYRMAEDAKSVSATIITNPLEKDSEFYHKNTGYDLIDERIGQITHLPDSKNPEELMGLFQDPRPRNIRRALREGVVIERRQDGDALDFLYKTHVANIEAIGGLSKRRAFFELVPEVMKESDWSIYLAKLNGKPIAALLVFYFNQTVEYFTPVVVESYRNLQALSLVIYKAMQDAVSNGFSNWNWGGTWLSQRGVYDFKKRWGTTDYRYYYYTRIYNDVVKKQKKEILLEMYPGFYVVPFSQIAVK